MTRRKHVPKRIETEVLVQSRRKCCLCFGLKNRDLTEKKGQIAHLDHDPSHNDLANLAYLCFDHHDQYDSVPRISKGLTPEEVKRYRDQLYEALETTALEPREAPSWPERASIEIMSSYVHIDRQEELNIFRDVLQKRREERILLVESPSGLGKTYLMLEYHRLAREAGIPCAVLDLRDVGFTVSDVLAILVEEWAGCPFRQFRCQVKSLQQPVAHVTIERVVQIGKSNIQVAIAGPDEAIRRKRCRMLTEALMADLRDWLGSQRRAVMLIDSYNPGPVTPELEQWVAGVLLPYVRRTPSLIVTIAGQKMPPASASWENVCCRLHLQPLDNPNEWMEFVRAKRISDRVDYDIVSAFCHIYKGHPMMLATKLSALQTWGDNP